MQKIIVDLDKCVGASICKDVCPVDVYDIAEMPEYNNEKKADPARMSHANKNKSIGSS